MKMIIVAIFATAFLSVNVAVGQQPQTPAQPPHPPSAPKAQGAPNHPHPPHPDPLAHLMFPPDMILGHARELNLTDEQKAFMRSEIHKTTASFQELQWKLQDQMELLHDTMKSTSVNEQQALAQLDKVLDIEREIKRLHFGMAVRLKNKLTPAQQEQLHKMKMGQHMGMPGPPPPRPLTRGRVDNRSASRARACARGPRASIRRGGKTGWQAAGRASRRSRRRRARRGRPAPADGRSRDETPAPAQKELEQPASFPYF